MADRAGAQDFFAGVRGGTTLNSDNGFFYQAETFVSRTSRTDAGIFVPTGICNQTRSRAGHPVRQGQISSDA